MPPAHGIDQAGKICLVRRPEVRMTAERRDFARQHPGQTPGPILRIGHDRRDLGKLLREAARLPEQLRPPIEPIGQSGRKASAEIGPHTSIFASQLIWPAKFIVQHWQRQPVAGQQCACGAMGCDGNTIDAEFSTDLGQARQDEGPKPFGVGMRIRAIAAHMIRRGARRQLCAIGGIDQHHLGIGFADIDNGNATRRNLAHGATIPGRSNAHSGNCRAMPALTC